MPTNMTKKAEKSHIPVVSEIRMIRVHSHLPDGTSFELYQPVADVNLDEVAGTHNVLTKSVANDVRSIHLEAFTQAGLPVSLNTRYVVYPNPLKCPASSSVRLPLKACCLTSCLTSIVVQRKDLLATR